MAPAKKATTKAAAKSAAKKAPAAKKAVSARVQRTRDVEKLGKKPEARRMATHAELDAYIRKVMKAHPESSRVDERKYARWIEGFAFAKKRWDDQWYYVEGGGRPLKEGESLPRKAVATAGFRTAAQKRRAKKRRK